MKSLVPLFQILKGFIRETRFFSRTARIAVLGFLFPALSSVFAETIQITPKNGVPSTWELVSVEQDRIIVRKGGARFEFSRDQIERVSNPEASRLLARAKEILRQVDQQDPETYANLEVELEKILPGLENASKHFSWLIPELVETKDQIAAAQKAISKTLDMTGSFEKDLEAIERMARGRAPVAANWEEVLDKTLASAREIPIEEIREEVLADLENFRRTIRLSLVRRTEETENRVRERAEAILGQLEEGEMDPAQWSLVLRDLRRQVSEQVPDADLRLELEEYLNRIETESQDKLAIAAEKILQRQIRESLTTLEPLVLDTTQTEVFSTQAEEVSAEISKLPESEAKSELQGILDTYRSDHEEALAQLQRSREPPRSTPSTPSAAGPTEEGAGWMAYARDWRILAAIGGVVALLVIAQVASAGRKKKRTASEIEDVEVVPMDQGDGGWAGGQEEDLSAILGSKQDSATPEIEASSADDLFGESSESEVDSEAPVPSSAGGMDLEAEIETPSEDPFGFSPTEELDPEESEPNPEESSVTDDEDPYGFSTVFGEDEPDEVLESPDDEGLNASDEPLRVENTHSEVDDLFGPPPSEEEISLLEPGGDPLAPEPKPPQPDELPSTSQPPHETAAGDEDDPFGLLSVEPKETSEDPAGETTEDLFGSPQPEEEKDGEEEDDIFGFGSYFEGESSDDDKSK